MYRRMKNLLGVSLIILAIVVSQIPMNDVQADTEPVTVQENAGETSQTNDTADTVNDTHESSSTVVASSNESSEITLKSKLDMAGNDSQEVVAAANEISDQSVITYDAADTTQNANQTGTGDISYNVTFKFGVPKEDIDNGYVPDITLKNGREK